jgi:hypothetical protein
MSDDETFAGRWSRRKQAHRAGKPPAETKAEKAALPAAPVDANAGDTSNVEGAKPDEPPPDLPSIDSLTKDSDYAPFLRANVPEALRNLALRKLWLSDPAFSAMDVLDHHNLDYTAPALTEAIKTVYQFGRGLLAEDQDKGGDEAKPGADSPPAQVASAVNPERDSLTPPSEKNPSGDGRPVSDSAPAKP